MKNKTLLLVDDDAIFLRVLARAMSRLGYEVLTANSIASAKHLLTTNTADFAIVDLHLGSDNGNDLIGFLATHYPGIKSLVLSGYANIPNAVAAVRLGAENCLPKPIDAEEIDRALRRLSGEEIEIPETWDLPEDIRFKHIVSYWEKNDRNVSETARKLNMHRRTLQRILRRAEALNTDQDPETGPTQFQKLRRRYESQARSVDL